MAQYFYGPDAYGARLAIDEVATQQKSALRWLDSDDLIEKSLAAWVGQSRGLFGVELLVVRDPSQFPKSSQEKIAASLGQLEAASCILWDRAAPDKRSKLYRTAKKIGREFSELTEPQLVAWLRQEAEARSGTIDQAAAQLLVVRLGSDRWRLQTELERLLLRDSTVRRELVEDEIVAPPQAEIFSTLEAVVRGEAPVAVARVEALLALGESEFYLLSMLAYQYRTLLVIKQQQHVGQSKAAVATATGLHPYVVEKSLPIVQRSSVGELLSGLTRIAATDFAIKQGKVDPRTGLMMLVVGLAQARKGIPR